MASGQLTLDFALLQKRGLNNHPRLGWPEIEQGRGVTQPDDDRSPKPKLQSVEPLEHIHRL
jgi:hypothetical protein